MRSRSFMLGIHVETAGDSDLPNVGALCRELQAWLDGLDPDAVSTEYIASDGDYPEQTWTNEGWRITFQAIPVKPEARKEEPREILGLFMDETGGAVDDETPLLNALNGKRPRRYGELDHPYVLAVCEYPFLMSNDGWHRKNALFGRSAIRFGGNLDQPEWTRLGGGFWRTGSGEPLNTRVSAILFGSHLAPWTVDNLRLEWWPHPFAAQPIPVSGIPRGVAVHSLEVTDGKGDVVVQEPSDSASTLL